MRAIASRRKRARTMFRKTTGTILCPSCGRLTTADAEACLVCGRRHPGMWGFAAPLRALFGRHSFTNVVSVAGAVGFLVSNAFGYRFTIGASGAVFGLLGAIVAFGGKRGGTFGAMVLRQYGYMALLMFVLSYFMPAVNNAAHAGGFAGGLLAGFAVSLAERRRETALDWVLAAACIAVTLAGFALSLWSTFAG